MNARKIYRWGVFLLAGGFIVRTILFGRYDEVFGPFRYLTVWALVFSFFAASRMMALEQGRSTRRWKGLVAMTAVLNTMVVLLFWRLYFADPASVTRDGALGDWYMEMYLHGVGPAVQVFDAVVLHRAPRAWRSAILWLVGVIAVYAVWVEAVVAPLNTVPSGTVTSGLPYLFLNNLEFGARAQFYATNLAVAFVVLAIYAGLTMALIRAVPRRRAAP